MELQARFTVWTLDVWGNEEEGFDVNDRSQAGTFEFDADLIGSSSMDHRILAALVEAGFLKPGSHEHGTVDGESDSVLYIDGHDGRPWLQLERIPDRFASLIFLQGDDAEEAMTILDNDGEDELFAHLLQWEMADRVPSKSDLGAGSSDTVREMREGDERYALVYNERWGYCGLSRIEEEA